MPLKSGLGRIAEALKCSQILFATTGDSSLYIQPQKPLGIMNWLLKGSWAEMSLIPAPQNLSIFSKYQPGC